MTTTPTTDTERLDALERVGRAMFENDPDLFEEEEWITLHESQRDYWRTLAGVALDTLGVRPLTPANPIATIASALRAEARDINPTSPALSALRDGLESVARRLDQSLLAKEVE